MQQQSQYPTIGTINNLPPQRCKIYPSRPLELWPICKQSLYEMLYEVVFMIKSNNYL